MNVVVLCVYYSVVFINISYTFLVQRPPKSSTSGHAPADKILVRRTLVVTNRFQLYTWPGLFF